MAELLDRLPSGKLLLYAILAFFLFLMFLVADFPYGDMVSSLLAPSGLRLDYQDQHLNLPFGARFDDVRLRYAEGSARESMLVESRDVAVSPALGSLLFGHPGLRIVANLRDGWMRVTLSASGDTTAASFTAHDVGLASFGALSQFAEGSLSGDGSIELDDGKPLDGKGVVELSGKGLKVHFGPALPPIELDQASGKLRMDHGVVTIENLQGHGRDLSISANGTIKLAPVLLQSIVDLSVTLTPTPSGSRRFSALLGFLPHPPGSRPYTVRGPMGLPAIT